MSDLNGLGIWIWELSHCEGGNAQAIAAKAKRSGVSWVAVKAGESVSNGQVTPALVDGLRGAGVECVAWWYSRPTTTASELALVKDLVTRCGIAHLIQDAELEWETAPGNTKVVHDWRREAAAFAKSLRATVGDSVYLADAPWPIVRAHRVFPFQELGAVMQARMPQIYYRVAEDGGESFGRYVADADASWASMGSAPVCPVASPVSFDGVHHAPVSELGEFLDRYAERPATSIWSWQHLSAAEWALLEARAAAAAPIDVKDDAPIFTAPDPDEVDEPLSNA